ncbi:MAG: hypothetical protein KKH98_03865, partial [Spirochaetes bacterium]|nr:hypothetical protein [Spirochaetota bacterium]
YSLYNTLFLRAGYSEKAEFTAGGGFSYSSYELNYAFEKIENIKNHKVSFTYRFPIKMSGREKENYYNRGLMHYNDFNFERSYEYFSRLYKTDPSYRETDYYHDLLEQRFEIIEKEKQARIAEAEGLFKEATEYYQKGRTVEAMNKLSECLKKNRKHQDAREFLRRLRADEDKRVNSEKAETRVKEGDLYFAKSDFPAAMVEYLEAQKLMPEEELYEAKAALTRKELDNLDKEKLVNSLYKEGIDLYKAGQYQKAIIKWKEAHVTDPEFTKAGDRIRETENKIKELEEKRIMEGAIKRKTDNLYQIALFKYERGDYSFSLFTAQEILQIDPEYIDAKVLRDNILKKLKIQKAGDKERNGRLEKDHLNKGIDLYKKGDVDKALHHLSIVAALNPDKSFAMKKLNIILNKMIKFEPYRTGKNASKYQLIQKHYDKGMSFFTKDNFTAAGAEWGRVFQIDPDEDMVQSKELTEADIQIIRDKQEKFIQYQLNLAKVSLKEKKFTDSFEEAVKILLIKPDHMEAKDLVNTAKSRIDRNDLIKKHLVIAQDYNDNYKYQDAVNEIKIVLFLDPENRTALDNLKLYEEKQNTMELNYSLDQAYNYYSSKNYKGSRKLLEEILQKDENNVKAKELIERIDEAEVEQDLTKVDRKNIIQLYSQGVSDYVNKKYNECIDKMKQVIEMDPDNTRALKYIEKSKERIAERSGSSPGKDIVALKKKVWQYYISGINSYMASDLDKAIREWNRALKLDPENEKIQLALQKAKAKKKILAEYE